MCALTGQTHQILILTAQLGMMPLVSVQPGISVPGTIRPTLKSAMISHSGVPSIAQMEPHALPSRTQQTFGMITQTLQMTSAQLTMPLVHALHGYLMVPSKILTLTAQLGMMPLVIVLPGCSVPTTQQPTLTSAVIGHTSVPIMTQMD